MPTAIENRQRWNEYEWPEDGAEWLEGFGGFDSAWNRVLLPRIEGFLPTRHMLEIGPGHGLWTQPLLAHTERMTVVDVAESCVAFCEKRFKAQKVRCIANNGRSLPGIGAGSLSFVFSFNSLVHADRRAMRGYAAALARTLEPGAFAFLHHSNLAACLEGPEGELPEEKRHWRGDVSAEWFAETCAKKGLAVRLQELIPWGSENLIDCFTVLQKEGQQGEPVQPKTIETRDFWTTIQGDPASTVHADRARALYAGLSG